jgi:hypothetical protein
MIFVHLLLVACDIGEDFQLQADDAPLSDSSGIKRREELSPRLFEMLYLRR